jgi:NADH-quinone oxidoreductase subunit E
MSVRRLADASVQPASFAFTAENAAWAERFIKNYPANRAQSAIIPLMMRAQDQEGWVSKAAIERIADMLGMPYIRALEVATFYTQYQLKPVGTRAHVQVCGTTPCMLRGSEALMDVCRSKIHHEQFHANESGTLSWEEVECLGACVNAPMVMIFKDTFEDLTPERLAEIIDEFDAGNGASVKPGPQNGRFMSAPITGFTSLQDEKAVLKSTRDKETKAAAAAAKAEAAAANAAAAGAATATPSNAAKPKTDAAETNPAIKSPSPVKTSVAAETSASVKAPAFSASKANETTETAPSAPKQRVGKAPRVSAETSGAPVIDVPAGLVSSPVERSQPKPSLYDKNRPAAIEKPATVDDLRLISGVGPKIESILNSLGIYTFAQVASWKKAERDWVDGYLNFKGRIDRDDWVRQAKALAKGGVTEYVRVFGKKPV